MFNIQKLFNRKNVFVSIIRLVIFDHLLNNIPLEDMCDELLDKIIKVNILLKCNTSAIYSVMVKKNHSGSLVF